MRSLLFPFATIVLSLPSLYGQGVVHDLSLKDAVDLALKQNPDVLLARLEEQRASKNLDVQRDPFFPKVFAGSGAAWSSGYPQSIDGNAPSIVQARVLMALYNKPLSLRVAQAKENQRGAALESSSIQDDAVYEVAVRFLDVAHARRSLDLHSKQAASFRQIAETIKAKVADGRALPLEQKKAELDLALANDKSLELQIAEESTELGLAVILGYPPGDRVRPISEENQGELALPSSEEAAIAAAYESSKNLKVLESKMQAKQLEIKSYKAEWLPQFDLVAQYALLGHYNYQDSINRFQPNNGQLGASFKIPLLVGPAAKAYASQGEVDLAKLRIQVQQTRTRIQSSIHQAYRDLERTESARDVSKKAVEWAQEQLRVLLERYEAGRIPLKEVEEARLAENEKWMAYFANNTLVERARLLVLKHSGTLAAALR